MRVLLFSERLRAPYDEGIKNVAMHLTSALTRDHDVLALTSGGRSDATYGLENVDTNRLLFSPRLAKMIRDFRPQAIVYVPTACGTVWSFLRGRILQLYGQGVPTALITLQPRYHTAWGKWLIGRLAPDWVLAQSTRTAKAFGHLGCCTALLPPAVDPRRFRPARPVEKAALRHVYGVPTEATVVSHVGHLEGERNLSRFLALQSVEGYHSVVVASTSTKQDVRLKESLREAGATVIDTYVTNIEEIYLLSDVYLFLTEEETAAIELPLSVLEAMACNVPVISTPFGGLPDFFAQGQGLIYWRGPGELHEVVETALSTKCATRAKVEERTWPAAAESVLRLLAPGGMA